MGLFKKDTKMEIVTDDNKDKIEKNNESGRGVEMGNESITNLTADVEIKGTIKFNKVMRIDGKFEGEIVANEGELIVGKTGLVKASVRVKKAAIDGRVDGNIIASEKVELKQKAQLIGDLQSKTLVIEEGVVFVGKCNVNPEGAKIETQNIKMETKGSEKDTK